MRARLAHPGYLLKRPVEGLIQLSNSERTGFRVLAGREAPELCVDGCPLKNKRAQGKPGARCTRGLVRMRNRKKGAHEHTGSAGNTPAFPAQWFYGLLRALPGERAFLPPSLPRSLLPRNLTPASRRQDHTASPSAPA